MTMKRKKTSFRGDINTLMKAAERGLTIDEAIRIARPRVDPRRAIRGKQEAAMRSLLVSNIGCIPHKEPRGYVYVTRGNMTSEHRRDAIARRQKQSVGLVKNSVRIAFEESRQQNLFDKDNTEARLLLESLYKELSVAQQQVAAELRRINGSRRRERKAV